MTTGRTLNNGGIDMLKLLTTDHHPLGRKTEPVFIIGNSSDVDSNADVTYDP